MKKFVLPAIGLLASLLSADAQVFAPTNLVVMTLGGPGQTLATSGNAMNLAQYTTGGTLVNTVTIPDSGANALICGGASSTEGYVSLSANGQYLVWAGYNTNFGSYSVALSTTGSSTNFRGVGTLDGYANYTLQYAGNIFSATSIRGAASDGTNNFWVNGGNTGIIYVGHNSPQATVFTASANERCLNIINGNLYFSTGSGTGVPGTGFWEVPGLPTTTGGGTIYDAGGQTGGTSPEDFAVNTNLGIAYLCDYDASTAGGGVIRYTYTSGAWVSNYTLITASGEGAYSVAVNWSGAHPVIYATVGVSTIAAGNSLVTFTDTGASSAATVIATAPAGQTFRGLCWAPGAAPDITAQPASLTNDYGQSAVFSVTSGGTGPLSYQWYSNSVANPTYVAIPSATAATLTLNNLAAGQNGSLFYVVVSNSYGTAESSTATLTVDPPGPPINVTVTPAAQTVNAESTAVFNVSYAGAQTSLSYGWKHNGTPLANGALGGSTISGATTASLTIANAFAVDDGSYTAFVTNSLGNGNSASSPAVLTVNDPAILTNVVGSTNAPGSGSVDLSVSAIGTGLTYQWLSNGVAISGANSSTYVVPGSTGSNTASYSVIVTSSSGGSVTNGPTVVSYTPVLLYDTFNYPNGDLFGDVGSPWTDINGTNPELVTNGRVQLSQSEATTDGQSLFAYPVNGTVVWASFTINVATPPLAATAGDYFANVEDTNFGFYGRLFTLTSNSPSLTPGLPANAYPGTYRIGIAGKQNDSATNSTTGPSAVIPLDLAPGINYELVFFVDMNNDYAAVAINPAAISDIQSYSPITGVSSGPTEDSFVTTLPMDGFGLRQRQTEGVIYLSDLDVSWDWNGAGSGYSVVTSAYTPATPVIGLQPLGTTNYSGNTYVMEIAASGIGAPGTGLTYAWYRNSAALSDGSDVTGSATPALTLNSLSGTDSGTYYCIATGTGSAKSSNAVVSVTTVTTAPSFTLPGGVEPVASTTASEGGTVIFSATAEGTGPITYEWYFIDANNDPAVAVGSGSTLTLSSLQTSQAGNYYAVATGGTGLTGTSTYANLVVTAPEGVSIGYLRGLQDYTAAPTITISASGLYTITGTVTVFDSVTSGTTTSLYLQDSTGGINLFITGDTTFRPAAGDIVTATGTIEEYNNNLEMDVTPGTEFETYTIDNGTNPLPAAQLLPWGYVAANLNSTTLNSNMLGSIVYMTNVYFSNYQAGVTNTFTNTETPEFYTITNNTGEAFSVFVGDGAQGTNLNGVEIPYFATTVTGVLALYTSTYTIILTSPSQIVTNTTTSGPPPSPIKNLMGTTASGGKLTLTWTAVPTTETYSVLYSTNAAGPYTKKLATGLTFSTTTGTYTTTPSNVANFYEISSP